MDGGILNTIEMALELLTLIWWTHVNSNEAQTDNLPDAGFK